MCVLPETPGSLRQLHLRFDDGPCEELSLFGGRATTVSIPAMAGDAEPSFAAESIALDLRLSLRPACPPPSGPAAPAWILACASPAERYGGSQLDVRNYDEL